MSVDYVAREVARRACEKLSDPSKRSACEEVVYRLLRYGDSVKEEAREEARRLFTEEERREIREGLRRAAEELGIDLG